MLPRHPDGTDRFPALQNLPLILQQQRKDGPVSLAAAVIVSTTFILTAISLL